MKRVLVMIFVALAVVMSADAAERKARVRNNVPLDSIVLSDPCILADSATMTYYMTGTGGLLWKSRDLKLWDGPCNVAETDDESWMGPNPMIWAAELHKYKGKYYYFATFTNSKNILGEYRGNKLERRASHVLVSDKAEGPYRPMADDTYLPAGKLTLDGTFWVDTDGKPYMVYSIWTLLAVDFLAAPRRITCTEQYPSISGPWIQEKEPITPPDFGHGMLFRTFDGRLLMSVHSHKSINGHYHRVPHLFNVDDSGDKLVIGDEYRP